MLLVVLILISSIAVGVAVMCAAEIFGLGYRRLAWQRRADSSRDLSAYFRSAGADADILEAVQAFFDQRTGVRSFPVRPDDDLRSLYGMEQEEILDALVAIAANARCLALDLIARPAARDLVTVADLVREIRRVQQRHAKRHTPAPSTERRLRA